MAETELTKQIKRCISFYKPALNSHLRTIRYAEEVDVGTGYVDVIRFEDYVEEDKSFCSKELEGLPCKIQGEKFPCKKCVGCVYKKNRYMLGILTTCFEIKISKSDFKSKNGNNFVGNHNDYVVPTELYPKIIDLVPDDIGVITYNKNGNFRKKKECNFKDVSAEDLNRFLFNALKKWVDKEKNRSIG